MIYISSIIYSVLYIIYIIYHILWHWVSAHQGHSSDAALAAQATYVPNEWRISRLVNQEKRKGNQPEVGDWNQKKWDMIYHQLIYQWSSTDISSTDHQKQGLNQEKIAYGQQKECKPQKWWFNPKKAPGWWKSTLCGIYIHGLISHQTDLTGSETNFSNDYQARILLEFKKKKRGFTHPRLWQTIAVISWSTLRLCVHLMLERIIATYLC